MELNNKKDNLTQPQLLNLEDDFYIIQKFIDGDQSAFKILVKRHKEKVRNIVYLTMSSSNLVDDIAQEVFITVYRKLKNFRFESQFTTWLYRITVNKCKTTCEREMCEEFLCRFRKVKKFQIR